MRPAVPAASSYIAQARVVLRGLPGRPRPDGPCQSPAGLPPRLRATLGNDRRSGIPGGRPAKTAPGPEAQKAHSLLIHLFIPP